MKYFFNSVKEYPYQIISSARSIQKFSSAMACSNLFNKPNLKLKFRIFDFHSVFDGLIGQDNLKHLVATINIIYNYLETPSRKVPVYFRNSNSQTDLSSKERDDNIIKDIGTCTTQIRKFGNKYFITNNNEKHLML